jgi:myosin-crossreactive antigen
MPFITSQFMPRVKGDRPDVVTAGAKNFAFIGQFCEIPDDVVFTVEYSVRSALMAVYTLLDIKKEFLDYLLRSILRYPKNHRNIVLYPLCLLAA